MSDGNTTLTDFGVELQGRQRYHHERLGKRKPSLTLQTDLQGSILIPKSTQYTDLDYELFRNGPGTFTIRKIGEGFHGQGAKRVRSE